MDKQQRSAKYTADETRSCKPHGNNYGMCLETTVHEIRSSSGWIRRLVREHKRSDAQQSTSRSLSFMTAKDSLGDSTSELGSTPSLVGSQALIQPETENMLLIMPSPQPDLLAEDIAENDPFNALTDPVTKKPPEQRATGWQGPPAQHLTSEPQSLVVWLAKLVLLTIAQAGLALFLVAMCRVIGRAGNAGLMYHQILQTILLTSSAQAVIVLQHSRWPALPDSKRTARTAHIILQCIAGAACLAALIEGAMRTDGRGIRISWKAPHMRMGIAAMIMFALQVLFGVAIVFVTRLFGGQRNAKHWYKYHRISGYATLTVMWTTGALGLHAVLRQEGSQSISAYTWRAVPRGTWTAAGAMLVLGIVFGIDVRKIGLNRSAQVKKGTFAHGWP